MAIRYVNDETLMKRLGQILYKHSAFFMVSATKVLDCGCLFLQVDHETETSIFDFSIYCGS